MPKTHAIFQNTLSKLFDFVRRPNFCTCMIYILFGILLVMHFFRINIDEWDIILNLFYIAIDFKVCKAFYHLLMIRNQIADKGRIYIYSYAFKSELKSIFNIQTILIFLSLFYIVLLKKDYVIEIFRMVLLWIPICVDRFISHPNKGYILEINNLHIGYGGALGYFKNYLEINMPHKFIERVNQFISYNGVQLEKKLFILVPLSCKIPHDLEDGKNIERCKELPKNEITHGGIKNRVYNMTVYYVRTSATEKGERMAVEYAQPLKTIYSLKEKGLITETEMFYQRDLCAEILKKFLRESDLNKFCEIIVYDDNLKKVSDVLLDRYYSLHKESV